MDEEYEDSMDDEKCKNCTYYRDDICLRKAGADEKICVHYVNRWNAKSARKALDELIDIMAKSLIK